MQGNDPEGNAMKRTIEIELEVADEDTYAKTMAATVATVREHGTVIEARGTGFTDDTLTVLTKLDPGGNWTAYRGSVHPDSA